jgi:hypothetical protein
VLVLVVVLCSFNFFIFHSTTSFLSLNSSQLPEVYRCHYGLAGD